MVEERFIRSKIPLTTSYVSVKGLLIEVREQPDLSLDDVLEKVIKNTTEDNHANLTKAYEFLKEHADKFKIKVE